MKLNSVVAYSKKMLFLLPAVAVAAAGLGTWFAGLAAGSIPSADGTITGCYSTNAAEKALYLIDPSAGDTCSAGDTQITFNQAGPQARRERPVKPAQPGRREPPGAAGATGPRGATGPQGPPGTAAPQAPPCPSDSRSSSKVVGLVKINDTGGRPDTSTLPWFDQGVSARPQTGVGAGSPSSQPCP